MLLNQYDSYCIAIYNALLKGCSGNVRRSVSDLYLYLSPNDVCKCVQESYDMFSKSSALTVLGTDKEIQEIHKKLKEMDVMFFLHGSYNYTI